MAIIQTGMTISFGTSSYSCEILGADGEAVRVALEAAHMGTTTQIPKVLGDLFDGGRVRVRAFHTPGAPPPISSAAETVTITFRLADGGTTAATLAGSAGITRAAWSSELEQLGAQDFDITWTGAYTWTAAT